MGRRGPAPAPNALKERQGKYVPKAAKEAKQPKPATLQPHPNIDKVAKTEWRRVAPELKKLGLLTVIDRDALAQYCTALSDFIEARATLAKEGKVVKSPKGYLMPHPAVAMQHKATLLILKFCQEFGMTPSSRSRMIVSPDGATKKKAADPTEGFLDD